MMYTGYVPPQQYSDDISTLNQPTREKYDILVALIVDDKKTFKEACDELNVAAETRVKIHKDMRFQKLLYEAKEKQFSKGVAGPEEVKAYLSSVMRNETKDTFDLDPSITDRNKAAELLGKAHRLFVDKVEIDGNVSISEILEKARKRAEEGTKEQ